MSRARHRRPPPPPQDRLTAALRGLGRWEAARPETQALADRVLATLGLAATLLPTAPPARRPAGGWARAWGRGVALVLLLLSVAAPSGAGPVEAREAWQRAQALKTGPWRERVRALREARAATVPTDSVFARALKAEASTWRESGRVHAATAAAVWAAGLGAESDPDRAAALLSAARALRDEGDDDAARDPLLAAARVARPAMPWKADEALDLLVEDAAERRDAPRTLALALRLEQERGRPSSRIEAWSRTGLLALERGARDEAQRCLARAEKAYASAEGSEPREAARATKAWLDAPLRRALEAK